MTDALEATARLYDEAAAELERALGHCRVAAEHFRSQEIPRGAAPRVGDARASSDRAARLDDQAREHVAKSSLLGD